MQRSWFGVFVVVTLVCGVPAPVVGVVQVVVMVDPLVAAVLTVCMVVLLRIVGPVPLWAAHPALRTRHTAAGVARFSRRYRNRGGQVHVPSRGGPGAGDIWTLNGGTQPAQAGTSPSGSTGHGTTPALPVGHDTGWGYGCGHRAQ